MDFLTDINTTEDKDKLLYEIELFKRQDYGNIRNSTLEFLTGTADLKKIEEYLKSLEVLGVILAIAPTASILEIILESLKRTVGKSLILDVSVDENLIGGAVFIYKGKYQDFSLLNTLNQ